MLSTLCIATIVFGGGVASDAAERPNVLWITCEDISANLGCYGDSYARTPNLDKLASESVRYTNMYATAPVCAPARSCIITGIHAESLGTQHLRAFMELPDHVRCYTKYLVDAGYYCTNHQKADYNFSAKSGSWGRGEKHWRARPEGAKFFSVVNLGMTHQSKTRYPPGQLATVNAKLPEPLRHDPAKAPLPPYYPDTERVRDNIASYHTQITLMDEEVGRILDELEQDGLAEDTIVFFYSDHGAGIPRGKRWLHHNGIRVPFIIRCPEKYRHLVPGKPGERSERLVSFVDLAPTMLSLAGLPAPKYMQGKAFLGKKAEQPRSFVFAARDRVDEEVTCSRTVVDGKFQYIRNFMPHRPRMQLSWYSEKTPIRNELRRLHEEGKLKGDEAWLLADTIPAEELYDLTADPHEMNNLVASPQHQEVLDELRKALYGHMLSVRDTGLLTEAEMYDRFPGSPYVGMHKLSDSEFSAILDAAKLVGMGSQHRETLAALLGRSDSAVRHWAAVGLAAMGMDAEPAKKQLRKSLSDSSTNVRIAAAEALCNIGLTEEALPVLVAELKKPEQGLTFNEAAIALYTIGPKAEPVLEEIRAASELEPTYKRAKKAGSSFVKHIVKRGIGRNGASGRQ